MPIVQVPQRRIACNNGYGALAVFWKLAVPLLATG